MTFRRYASLTPQQSTRYKDGNGDLVVEMAFASETPYERWWGIEILDMSEQSVDLSRLNDGASLLFNHNWSDLRGAHVPSSVRIDGDRVLRGKVRITSATQAGRDALALVDTGILTKTSIGYEINKVIEQTTKKTGDQVETVERELDGRLFERVVTRAQEERPGDVVSFQRALDAAAGPFERADDKPTIYRVVDWTPLENSLVTIPADATVGVGRSKQSTPVDANVDGNKTTATVTAEAAPAQAARANPQPAPVAKGAIMSEVATNPAAATVTEPELQAKNPIAYEQARKQAIINLVKANKLDERIGNAWITQGASMEQVSKDILQILEERSKTNPEASAAHIGMENKDVRRYSLMKAIKASATGNWSDAQLEHEASQAVAARTGKDGRTANSFFLPLEVQKRDASVAGTGAYLVGTNNLSFIELLRNRMVAYQMGATRLGGLVGNVTIPKQTVGATAYWLASETTGITEGNQTFAQLPLTPRTVGAYTQISRLLQLQSSPDAEQLILSDLAKQVAIAADLAVLHGTGTEQPTGITATANIGTDSGTSFTYATVLEFQSDVAAANALSGTCGYVTTPAIAALAMSRPTFTNGVNAIWTGSMLDGMVGGFKAMSSAQVATAGMLFGDWASVVIGEWGVLELAVNPNDNFAQGLTGLRAMYTMDVGVRHVGAWSWGAAMT